MTIIIFFKFQIAPTNFPIFSIWPSMCFVCLIFFYPFIFIIIPLHGWGKSTQVFYRICGVWYYRIVMDPCSDEVIVLSSLLWSHCVGPHYCHRGTYVRPQIDASIQNASCCNGSWAPSSVNYFWNWWMSWRTLWREEIDCLSKSQLKIIFQI